MKSLKHTGRAHMPSRLFLAVALLVGGGVCVDCVAQATIEVPALINYQGQLIDASDPSGAPAAPGAYVVEFRVWDHATSTDQNNLMWGRRFAINVATNGLFSVLISDGGIEMTTPGPVPQTSDLKAAFQGDPRFLELALVEGATVLPMSPRQRMASAPYAMQAQYSVHARSLDAADGNPENALYVDVDGDVGIGTVAPNLTTKLDVAGSINASDKIKEDGNDLIPQGVIVMWNGTTPPSGWALCNGLNGTPDLRSKFIVGYSGSGAYNNVGNQGGAASVTLTVSQMPAHGHYRGHHTHSYVDWFDSDDNYGSSWGSSGDEEPGGDDVAREQNTKTSHDGGAGWSNNNGSGNSHENRPPYYTLAFIMKL